MTARQWVGSFVASVALVLVIGGAALAPSANADFGIVPGSFRMVAVNRDGTLDGQAGSHPYAFTVSFDLNRNAKGEPEGNLRDVEVDLPPGLVGNPTAVPRCSIQEFDVGQQAFCPGNTQVGVVKASLRNSQGGATAIQAPVFNLVPPPSVPAALGFSQRGLTGVEDASVRTGKGYGVAVTADGVPTTGIGSVEETIWGVPPDPGHDEERQCVERAGGKPVTVNPCSSDVTPRPFLTLPGACGGSPPGTLLVDSEESLGTFPQNALSESAVSQPTANSGCEHLSFEPRFSAQPDTVTPESPSGLNVDLKVPQPESPEGLAEADLKEAVVTLPEGMTVSPSAANGLAACPLTGPNGINLASSEPAHCLAASKIGSVEIQTPLLEHTLKGGVFVAQQGNLLGNGENPFGTLLSLYVVAEGEGVAVKLPGRVELDQATGRIAARFGEDPLTGESSLPQDPFSELKMTLYGGPSAPLMTPSGCGTYTTSAVLTPYGNEPGFGLASPPVSSSSAFTIDQGCAAHGFAPTFAAGTTNPQAGAYSPFSVTLSRNDGEQRLKGVRVTTPPGLLGVLRNVVRCPEPQASEEALEACGPQSLIGETYAAAGPGPDPFWTKGKVYLTGPYRGAPFGLKIVVPAVAGPFNIGRGGAPIVVRAKVEVDPRTAQISVMSDPLPTILQGVSLDLRTIDVTIDRPNFMFNPTDCSPLAVAGAIESTETTAAGVSSPFEAANCAALPFKPSFTASTQGRTSKANGASLMVTVVQRAGEAGIHKVDLQLPLILPARLTTLQKACTAAQFEANPAGCPEASVIGSATAVTPVLSAPLTGPAYLVSHGGAAFPDVEFVLQGEGVKIILDGLTDIKKGITYSKFETVPDAPISSFQTVLPEGPHSALAANGNLCHPTTTVTVRKRVTVRVHGRVRHITRTIRKTVPQPLVIPTVMTGQNGAVVIQNTGVSVTGCLRIVKPKPKPHAKGKRRKK